MNKEPKYKVGDCVEVHTSDIDPNGTDFPTPDTPYCIRHLKIMAYKDPLYFGVFQRLDLHIPFLEEQIYKVIEPFKCSVPLDMNQVNSVHMIGISSNHKNDYRFTPYHLKNQNRNEL